MSELLLLDTGWLSLQPRYPEEAKKCQNHWITWPFPVSITLGWNYCLDLGHGLTYPPYSKDSLGWRVWGEGSGWRVGLDGWWEHGYTHTRKCIENGSERFWVAESWRFTGRLTFPFPPSHAVHLIPGQWLEEQGDETAREADVEGTWRVGRRLGGLLLQLGPQWAGEAELEGADQVGCGVCKTVWEGGASHGCRGTWECEMIIGCILRASKLLRSCHGPTWQFHAVYSIQ